MDTPVCLGHRHTLDAMRAALVLHATVSALAPHHKRDILNSTLLSLVRIQHLDLPTIVIGIAAVHAEDFACKERSFVTTSSTMDGHNRVFLVHNVFRQ